VAVELGTGYVSIVAETSKLEAGIKRALEGSARSADAVGKDIGTRISAQASNSLGSGMRSVGALGAKALGGAMLLGVGAAAAGVSAVLGSALTKGFDRLKSIDDAKFKLKALGNSAKDVQAVMDSALASVKGTSFGLGDAATIAASAIAAGVAPGQELTKYLTLTADAAAVAGTSLSDMGMIINQVRTTGVAYNDTLQQLSGRGIPIYQWLGKEAGVAAEAVNKLAADGQISSAMLEAAIQKNIGGAAKTMGESFSGSVANAQAALGVVCSMLADVESARPLRQGDSEHLDKVASWVQGEFDEINSAFK
jgi:tape measure domain-containing protein